MSGVNIDSLTNAIKLAVQAKRFVGHSLLYQWNYPDVRIASVFSGSDYAHVRFRMPFRMGRFHLLQLHQQAASVCYEDITLS